MNTTRKPSALFCLAVLVAASLGAGCQTPPPAPGSKAASRKAEAPLQRIAFGSCADEEKDPSFWNVLKAQRPDLFVFLGDTVYGDEGAIATLPAAFAALGALPEYQSFRAQCPVLAVWDDHDYGMNDGGADNPIKQEAKDVFLNFFGEPETSPRRGRPGIQTAVVLGPPGRQIQILLLDTRWFRSPLLRRPLALPGEGPYEATPDEESTILGEEQWAWLEQQLQTPAEVRLLVSSIQVLAEEHHWETWGQFPHERERLFEVLRRTGVEGLLVVSGDRHFAEVSRLDAGLGYPLYDVTSSSLNAPKMETVREPNRHRVGAAHAGANFGLLLIDWKAPDPTLAIELHDAATGSLLETHSLLRSELSRPPPAPPTSEPPAAPGP